MGRIPLHWLSAAIRPILSIMLRGSLQRLRIITKNGSVSTKKTIGIRLRSRKMEHGIVWLEAKAETRLRPKSIKCRYKIDIPIYFITINPVAIHRIMPMP